MEYTLREASETDRKFLYGLHCQTMRELIIKTWGWDEEWQVKDFDDRFRLCEVSVIQCHGCDAGAVFLRISPETIFIEELQILPEYQSQGIGSAVVRQLIERARFRGATVTLSVLPINVRAKELYERLGFEVISVEVPFIRMCHRCSESG